MVAEGQFGPPTPGGRHSVSIAMVAALKSGVGEPTVISRSSGGLALNLLG